MTVLENKLQNIHNKLSTLIFQFKKICVSKISNIPTQIERIVIGQNKLKMYIDQSAGYEINENDLSNCTSIIRYAFHSCTNLTSVTIPNTITVIDVQSFYGCTSLTSIIIPDSVIRINSAAFQGCSSLTDMYMHPTTPPTLGNTQAISTATTTIHVPIGSGEAYRTATNWSSFADKIVEDIEI